MSLAVNYETGYYIKIRINRSLLIPFRPALSRLFIVFPEDLFKYMLLGIWQKLLSETRAQDPLYFIHHKDHLSTRLTLSTLVTNAITHHEYEFDNYTETYERQVYRGDGIRLQAR